MRTKVEVEIETLTPLFLAGADPRGTPELRAASVRGALRYWLRALLGGVLGDRDLDALKGREAEVFGSTSCASSVVVRLEAKGELPTGSFQPLLHNPRKRFPLLGIKPGATLSLSLEARPPAVQVPDPAFAALLVFLLLGGLGKRSRRGFGSLALRSAEEGFPWHPNCYKTAGDFKLALSSALEWGQAKVQSWLQAKGVAITSPSNSPNFAILHPSHAKVLFCQQGFSRWEEAMKAFWGILRSNSYRDQRVFGFAGKPGRQSSPLHLRIVRIGQGYHLLLTAFRTRFKKDQPDWGVMQNFLNECQKKWSGHWCFGGSAKW